MGTAYQGKRPLAMNIVLVSQFRVPSRYQNISEGLALSWHQQRHNVVVLGIDYRNEEHTYPFSLIPTTLELSAMNLAGITSVIKADWVIFLTDIVASNAINANLSEHQPNFHKNNKIASIVLPDSDPIAQDWASKLKKFSQSFFTFTHFSAAVLGRAGILATKLPVGLRSFWYSSVEAQPEHIFSDSSKFVLTIANNLPIKNIPAAIAMFSQFKLTHPDYRYLLITNPFNPNGWDITELFSRSGLTSNDATVLGLGSLSQIDLSRAMWHAGCLLLPSHAAGLGLSIYEAQSQGCPVVATNCTGISEAAASRELLINVDGVTTATVSTANQYWPNIIDGVAKMGLAVNKPRNRIVYPTWDQAAGLILETLTNVQTQ